MDLNQCLTILELNTTNPNRYEIGQAFRRLSFRYHPDKNRTLSREEASEKFRQIYQARLFLIKHLNRQFLNSTPPIIIELPVSLYQILHGCTLKKQLTVTRVRYGISLVKKVKEDTVIEIRIAPGTVAGTRISFPQAGNQLDPDAPPGDVIVIVRDKPHPKLKRFADVHLEYEAHISQHKYLTGGVVELPSLDGSGPPWRHVDRDILRGGSIRIPNQGLPVYNEPHKRGDLIVRFVPDLNLLTRLLRYWKSFRKQMKNSSSEDF